MAQASNWTSLAHSRYQWEQDALSFVQENFPSRSAHRAWSNFEFVADDGSVNEIDLLVFTPRGFFLIEIKSRPGSLRGDAGTWTWQTESGFVTEDSPLVLANTKAKKLRSLLQRQRAFRNKGQVPFIEPLVFCSDPGLHCELEGNAALRICLRDTSLPGSGSIRNGILAAILDRQCAGLTEVPRGVHDRPMSKVISQAMDQSGIRPSKRSRRVNDYELNQLIDEGPGYQDWIATHVKHSESRRRVRLYNIRTSATGEDRAIIQRAAHREFEILESLQHPGILRATGTAEHELGPAILFEHDPLSIRLDHYLAQRKDQLSVELQLHLIRQLAEVMRYAHEKKFIHRGLSPRSILVCNQQDSRPSLKVFNWQFGFHLGTSSTSASRVVTATSHVERLMDDSSTAYMAPESVTESDTGEHLDVFSLGAIAYHLFAGTPPATSALELSEKLRESKGLQLSSVLNGASEEMQELVRCATHPIVPDRLEGADQFLSILDDVEKELTSPEIDAVEDPSRAQIGDLLPGGFTVVRRLGQGACSVALLVQRNDEDFVLKVANDEEQNARILAEADVLRKDEMRHPCIVDFVESVELGRFQGFLMRPVYVEKEKRLIETLGQRLRKEGRLHIDMLQRFGEDLLNVVNHLEEQGIPHRDIKPENIAVGMVGRGNKLHLVLFDFSLSRTADENIRAGTTGYLDPLLPLRKPARWDLNAERYSAGMTLYELATGTLATWGDGNTDPSHLSDNTEITIDPELFDPALRESLTEFFSRAFRRNPQKRFDNAEQMLRTWRDVFAGLDESDALADETSIQQLRDHLATASFETTLAELGLGLRATNALDRANLLTVEDLLSTPIRRLQRLRGVGNQTRREIAAAVRFLHEHLGKPGLPNRDSAEVTDASSDATHLDALSVDLLASRLLKTGIRDGDTFRHTVRLLLGLADDQPEPWPTQAVIGTAAGVTRGRIAQILTKLHTRWSKDAALTKIRAEMAEMIAGHGGVVSLRELCDTLLMARGSAQDEPRRTSFAGAVIRAATEVEKRMVDPRFVVKRSDETILIAHSSQLAAYAKRLGDAADQIAAEDPLLAPTRVLERLRDIPASDGVQLSDTRLLRLAVDASTNAAVSSRQEIYPRSMDAQRALKLSHGALLGQRTMTTEQVIERVSGRYPEAAALPPRPELDNLLESCGCDLRWDESGRSGQGCYLSPLRNVVSVTSGSHSIHRLTTGRGTGQPGEITPEEADARQFEERLNRSLTDGAFLAIMVNPSHYNMALHEFRNRYPVEIVDLEGIFLDALRETAGAAKVDWNLVLQTDARPHQRDWDKLMMLVKRTMIVVERQLLEIERTILLIHCGLLARYDQMDLLSRLSQKVGRDPGIPGLWLLLPGQNAAMIDGKPVALIGPGQRATIPDSWILNSHRAQPTGTDPAESPH